jgi:hypothetical protein
MELTRLKEILDLTPAKTVIAEAKTKPIDGIVSIVEDALGDLNDKLGKGGALATLMKETGASKLDIVINKTGKNVLRQINDLTAEYKFAIERLMVEAELLVGQVDESIILEGKEFEDSAEFTDEFYGIMQDITKMKGKMKAPRWMAWMRTTDENFGTSCESPARAAITAIGNLEAQIQDIDAEFDKIDE